MLLSNKDVEKIKNLGYAVNYFVENKKDWLKLKNKNGRCIFHDGTICLIYDKRPEGCKLFPLIYDEEYKYAILDEECPYKDNFKFNSVAIKKLYDLVNQIILERNNRINKY